VRFADFAPDIIPIFTMRQLVLGHAKWNLKQCWNEGPIIRDKLLRDRCNPTGEHHPPLALIPQKRTGKMRDGLAETVPRCENGPFAARDDGPWLAAFELVDRQIHDQGTVSAMAGIATGYGSW
jgi:hypothetical protein